MFEHLTPQPPDPLLKLIELQRNDPRSGKIDLGVGVYRDTAGQTPVMRAVKAAERRLLESQPTKAYVGASGDGAFLDLIGASLFRDEAGGRPLVALQTPGGTAALRLAGDLLVRGGAGAIWIGRPSWANHDAIFAGAGLPVRDYAYFDAPSQSVTFDRMTAALSATATGDAVLLQASCHNPTGADLSLDQWGTVAAIVAERGLIPLIDIAYQGLAGAPYGDLAGVRKVLAAAPEALAAISMSKSFGLYRERTGALFATAASPAGRDDARSNLLAIARANYSMPPDHGAAVVRLILEDPALTADWLAELAQMRARIDGVRQALARTGQASGLNLAPLADQRGMFSLLPLSPAQIARLRDEHAVYMTDFGRVNVAGLTEADLPALVAAIKAVV